MTDVTDLYAPMRVAPMAISPQNAHLITDMLQDVIRHGTGARAQRDLARSDLAGKTGTTNDGRDTWFVGFSRDFVAAAWVGFDQDRPLGGREQGGITAIPMWIGFMAEALDGVAQQPFRTPPGDRRGSHQPGKRPRRERRESARNLREVRYRQHSGTRARSRL